MKNVVAFLCGMVFIIAAATAVAQNASCPNQPYEYRASVSSIEGWDGNGPYYGSAGAAATAYGTHCQSRWNSNQSCSGLSGSSTTTWTLTSCTNTYSTSTCTFTGYNSSTGNTSERTRTVPIARRNTVECPPDACDARQGKQITYGQSFPSFPSLGTNYAMSLGGGCGADMTGASSCTEGSGGSYFCMVTYTYTGDPPTASPAPQTPTGQQGDCATRGGKQECAIKTDDLTGQSCGTLNGERMCFPKDPNTDPDGLPSTGECWNTPKGGLLCSDSADVKDDNDQAIAPDRTIVTNNTTTNYYSNDTVTTNNANTTVKGVGVMGGTGTGDGSGTGGGGNGNCQGADCLTGGTLAEAPTMAATASGAYGRLAAAPIVAALADVAPTWSGGSSCPVIGQTVNMGMFGSYSIDFGSVCTMWSSIAGILSAVMLACWALLAARIFMSA